MSRTHRRCSATAAGILTLGALAFSITPAAAAQQNNRCPDAQWYQGDLDCRMTHNGPGSRWYEGEWVAVHITADGAWANGYDPHPEHRYQVAVGNGGSTLYSGVSNGGTGVGLSVGKVAVTSKVTGAIGISPRVLTVTRTR
ncbi:hypothetical protein ACFXB4_16125 [Streptomyces lavendulae]|uniref:hypothetical protein n=1 Tax=Streptomyces lavendulae TaxID=1914 RepID=UPI0036A23AEC